MRRKEERSKQHSTPKAVTSPKKNELPRVGLEPTILHTLDNMYMYMYIHDAVLHVHCMYMYVHASNKHPVHSYIDVCLEFTRGFGTP